MMEQTIPPSRCLALWGVLVSCISLDLAGCAPDEPARYVLSEQTKELPPRLQEQSEKLLRQYFGEAGNPHWMMPDPKALKEADAEAKAIKLIDKLDPAQLRHGMEVYNLRCFVCHGTSGDGAGVAAKYLEPKPRDYRLGVFKFTSTSQGARPVRADLVRIIRNGAKGTAMPSFRWLSPEDLQAVVDYVMYLSYRGQFEQALIGETELMEEEDEDFSPYYVAKAMEKINQGWQEAAQKVIYPAVPNPPVTDETIRLGALEFQTQACPKCHGRNGKGGRQPGINPADLGKDSWGNVAYPADFTSGMLHGGRRPIDVYRNIASGISPMPVFEGIYKDDPEKIWYLTHFILSVADGGEFLMPEVPRDAPVDDASQAPPTEADGGEGAAKDEDASPQDGEEKTSAVGREPATGLSLNPPKQNASQQSSRK